jgi:hypothetical protein
LNYFSALAAISLSADELAELSTDARDESDLEALAPFLATGESKAALLDASA